jgi:hypothetical protein
MHSTTCCSHPPKFKREGAKPHAGAAPGVCDLRPAGPPHRRLGAQVGAGQCDLRRRYPTDDQSAAVAKAKDWPAWGHRKVTALLHADGVPAAEATVKRALRRNGPLLPVNHTTVIQELADARRAAFVTPPWRRNQVWQLDFSEYETLVQSTWRLAGMRRLLGQVRAGLPRLHHLQPPRRDPRRRDRHQRSRTGPGPAPDRGPRRRPRDR